MKGNTIVLDEKPDLPEECPAWIDIRPVDQTARDEEVARRQFELLKHPQQTAREEGNSSEHGRDGMTEKRPQNDDE